MSGMERKRYLWMFVWLLLPEAIGTYLINVTLPVGTAMNISGRQEVTTLTASALGRSVSGKQYGTVSVITRTWNRQHTGGTD